MAPKPRSVEAVETYARAVPIGGRGETALLPPVIEFKGYPPEGQTMASLKELATFYEEQAQGLEETLHDILPGGTYDRLCAAVLQRKAGMLKVSYGSLVDGD